MKILILILFLFYWVNVQSQPIIDGYSYNKRDAIISASILGATFITAETFANRINGNQAAVLNMSGIAISAGYSLLKTTKPVKKLQRRIKMNRNKSNNEILICEK